MKHSCNSVWEAPCSVAMPVGSLSAHTIPRGIPAAATLNGLSGEAVECICHELRNSLAVVRGAGRLLSLPITSDGIRNARLLIERHVSQMDRHIEDLLQPLRREGRMNGLRLTYVDLRVVARHASDGIAPEMMRRGHRLALELPEEPIWAQADAARLEQVFSNLLINAAKYTPDGGNITFTVERVGESVLIRVQDSGIGIEPGIVSRVFDLFTQADAALPRADGGRGIGLAVVRNLVQLHGGTVKAASAGRGCGSVFTVTLPVLWGRIDA